ncbi:MAG: hypothetical protein ABIW84_07625 [Ilumatobacteraceae bacterium]
MHTISEPSALWLLRHGQSQGNVIRDAARGQSVEVLDIAERDMDEPAVRRSAEVLGERIAAARRCSSVRDCRERRPVAVCWRACWG